MRRGSGNRDWSMPAAEALGDFDGRWCRLQREHRLRVLLEEGMPLEMVADGWGGRAPCVVGAIVLHTAFSISNTSEWRYQQRSSIRGMITTVPALRASLVAALVNMPEHFACLREQNEGMPCMVELAGGNGILERPPLGEKNRTNMELAGGNGIPESLGEKNRTSMELVERLLTRDPAARSGSCRGAAGVKAHPFFALLRSARHPHVHAAALFAASKSQARKPFTGTSSGVQNRTPEPELACLSRHGPQGSNQTRKAAAQAIIRLPSGQTNVDEGSNQTSPASVLSENEKVQIPKHINPLSVN
ncbi:hypothetical protein EJB05_22347 [Eragrostis curvula]|uniref:Uncharacterized protein n=1 Tax=Eragrostis curvula TaxID=38414 RepID=A0A5J9V3D0_9POAL|nr:hypothetical protein EJB05_22347 [Eragrostis curvula]